MRTLAKDWDRYVAQAEDVARGPAFQELRDRIVDRANPRPEDQAVDIGAGTGLLTLGLAACVDRVWAIDVSPAMCDYLRAKVASAGFGNVEIAVASAISLPLVDGCADLAVSNYCLHHLSDQDKHRALSEIHRVLRPSGRLVIADMMFRPSLADRRDRRLVATKTRAMLRKGPGGYFRLAKNAVRFVTAAWERPARPEWWREALVGAGFDEVSVETLEHEGGIATGRKAPSATSLPRVPLAPADAWIGRAE
jgi:ubiquinone/menaquinone biosynthesis C-methylase UbiE